MPFHEKINDFFSMLLLGVWRSQHWQSQRVAPITSYDVGGGSFLFFGASNGSIYYIDMEKFPLRMKDNDLLVRNYNIFSSHSNVSRNTEL